MSDDVVFSIGGVSMGTVSGAIDTLRGQVMWNGMPVIDDDDGGTAGVREPRRPGPQPLTPAAMELAFA